MASPTDTFELADATVGAPIEFSAATRATLCIVHVDALADELPLTIADNLARDAGIGEAELDAIERYMSDILDVVLGSGQANIGT